MKVIAVPFIVLLVFATTLIPARGADCVRPAEGLLGWWTGDGTAADLTGNHHGVLHGGARADVPGFIGTAFGFDGINDYVEVPESTALRPVNFTIEAWVNFSSLDSIGDGGAPPGEQYLVFRQNSRRGDFEGFALKKIRKPGGDVFTFLVASASGQLAELDATAPIVTNTWYHVAGVRGTDHIRLYVDGQLVVEGPVDFPQDYGDYPLFFGTTGQSYWDRKLNGALDEVALYDRPLTSVEIAAIYAAGALGKCKTLSRVLVQPESQTVAAESNPLFSAIAQAAEPLTYQWTFNDAVIPGATEKNLALTNVRPADSGRYAVIAAGSSVVLTSTPAVLSVQLPPTITTQPQHNAGWLGASVDFSVAVTGHEPIQYHWHYNGSPLSPGTRLSGVATHHLTITDLQPGDAGEYTVTVVNAVGEVTSAPAVLTIAGPPFVISQPANQRVVAGSSIRFTVEAVGTAPMFYQWRFGQTNLSDGANISGATRDTLILNAARTNDAGGYSVVITNQAGQTTSSVAFLEVDAPLPPGSIRADAVVLINSSSAACLEFQHFIQPYLENFGVPYVVQDVATNVPGAELGEFALIIIGHRQFDTNLFYLSEAVQRQLSLAISNGTGLVNFDSDLEASGVPRYQFVQDVFGFDYAGRVAGSTVAFPTTEPGLQMHFITKRRSADDPVSLRDVINTPALGLPGGGTVLATLNDAPLLVARRHGRGSAVQWGSYAWMNSTVLGPVGGMDDLLWRGIAWAARKPFVIRGMPHLISMRVDDVEGSMAWVDIATEYGFKPFLGLFYLRLNEYEINDLRLLITNGNATASIHSFDWSSEFFYFNHATRSPWPDNVQSNHFYIGTQWHLNHHIPISKVCATHFSEIGLNAFAGLKAWGIEFVPIEVVPETIEYTDPGAPWLVAGPYRLYEPPQPGKVNLPTFYADWLKVPGHPEFDGHFFNVYSEVRDLSECGEWCPDNNVDSTVARGTRMMRRTLDSMVMTTLFTHEPYIKGVSVANWRAILQGLTNNLAAYAPRYVTLDYASQYVRATRTSRLVSSAYDPGSGQVAASFAGSTDLETEVLIFAEDEQDAIRTISAKVPPFAGVTTEIVTIVPKLETRPLFAAALEINGEIFLTLTGEVGRRCRVEGSSNGQAWEAITTVILTNGTATVSEPMTAGHRFYRAAMLAE